MDITLPYVREREKGGGGGGRERKDWWRGGEKNVFAAVSVNKYIRMATETDVASAKGKCLDGGEGGERVTRGEDRS